MTERWEFGYVPVPTAAADDDGEACDVIVATRAPVDMRAFAEAAGLLLGDVDVECVLDRAPLHWYRVSSGSAARRADIARALAAFDVRYVASATRATSQVGAPACWDSAARRAATDWRARPAREPRRSSVDGTRWFLGKDGVDVDREVCGTGAGMRLAVIDEDTAEANWLDLDRVVLLRDGPPPGGSFHGTLMVAWAVGTRSMKGAPDEGFVGVAPDASPRIYCVPKAGHDVFSVPYAIVRAVDDGADVVLATTFLEGTYSPMLDDALELAARLGRGGRGTPIVMAAGRQPSSPRGSLHASWTLGYDDPAADPRVFCVGPSGRSGGWFYWRSRGGKLHPFANRSPALRWLAPGDDIQYPFEAKERWFHAESSGASAIAAGALLLVLAANPRLSVRELDDVVTRTCVPASAGPDAERLVDPYDALPAAADRDGHDAKHGYGRISATRACLAARDPLAQALVAIGEDEAARRWVLDEHHGERRPYSRRFGRWAARAALADAGVAHALRAVARHARLVAGRLERFEAHGPAAVVRQLTTVAVLLERSPFARGRAVAAELSRVVARSRGASVSLDAERLFRAVSAPWSSGVAERDRSANSRAVVGGAALSA